MKKFDCKKFHPGASVKITFAENKKTFSGTIISIGEQKISFESSGEVFECIPSEIKNIKFALCKTFFVSTKRLTFLLFAPLILLVGTYRKIFLLLITCCILFYVFIIGIRTLNYEVYEKACKKEAYERRFECYNRGANSLGKFNVYTGCSLKCHPCSEECVGCSSDDLCPPSIL